MYGGTNRATGENRPEDFDTFVDALLVRNENTPAGAGNQLASIDVRYRFQIFNQPIVLYLEQGGEDEAGNLPSRHAYLGAHRGRRGARLARRDEGAHWAFVTEEQRRQAGCLVGRMQRDFHHGLLVS